jgi:hypothetical protein
MGIFLPKIKKTIFKKAAIHPNVPIRDTAANSLRVTWKDDFKKYYRGNTKLSRKDREHLREAFHWRQYGEYAAKTLFDWHIDQQ